MKIALEQLIHVQRDNACVEQMIYVCHLQTVIGMTEIARGVHLGNALINNHCSCKSNLFFVFYGINDH